MKIPGREIAGLNGISSVCFHWCVTGLAPVWNESVERLESRARGHTGHFLRNQVPCALEFLITFQMLRASSPVKHGNSLAKFMPRCYAWGIRKRGGRAVLTQELVRKSGPLTGSFQRPLSPPGFLALAFLSPRIWCPPDVLRARETLTELCSHLNLYWGWAMWLIFFLFLSETQFTLKCRAIL